MSAETNYQQIKRGLDIILSNTSTESKPLEDASPSLMKPVVEGLLHYVEDMNKENMKMKKMLTEISQLPGFEDGEPYAVKVLEILQEG